MKSQCTTTGAGDAAQAFSGITSPLIIQEPPLQVLPGLAIAIGLNEAIVLQQLHYLLRNPKFGKRVAEHQWIFNTIEEWRCQYFPFWSEKTIQRVFTSLAERGLVVTCQPEGRLSRRKYYRVNMEKLVAITEQDKLSGWNRTNRALPNTKTTCKESKESKEDIGVADVSFSPEWKPKHGSKEEKLRQIRIPRNYPSESEFDNFITDEDLGALTEYRPDLYSTLCECKWHQWRESLLKWVPIRDWKAYVIALSARIDNVF